MARIRSTLEEAQTVEQAGFRRNFSNLDHIATCRRLIEASREHRLPVMMNFIDYKKAFDSVELVKAWEALEKQERASEMLLRLDEEGSHCGLTINTSKTKVMRNQFSGDTRVSLKGDVDEYVYLDSQLNMRDDLTEELVRRRKAGWAAFNSIRSVLED
uniref:Reverse transcriptase domain-containing protein n=1 Tax=Haemonchus contortus TaxID=6289 RepID=A0A7I4XSI2_HAECO